MNKKQEKEAKRKELLRGCFYDHRRTSQKEFGKKKQLEDDSDSMCMTNSPLRLDDSSCLRT